MQNSKITMKELLYKMACYQELYPNVHLFEKIDLNQMNSNFLRSTIEAFRLKKDCTKLEYCKDKLYHVISKYYVVDQRICNGNYLLFRRTTRVIATRK